MSIDLLAPSNGLTNTDLSKANADITHVREGMCFYASNGELKTGVLLERNEIGRNGAIGLDPKYPQIAFNYTNDAIRVALLDGNYTGCVAFCVPYGFYHGGSYVGVKYEDLASVIGLTPEVIAKDYSILGITGTFTG